MAHVSAAPRADFNLDTSWFGTLIEASTSRPCPLQGFRTKR